MPERWYSFWRKHHQWIQKIILLIPPVNAKHMNCECKRNANQNGDFPLSLQPKTIPMLNKGNFLIPKRKSYQKIRSTDLKNAVPSELSVYVEYHLT